MTTNITPALQTMRLGAVSVASRVLTATPTGTADDIRRRVRDYAAQGITEIIYQPTGPDIPGELEAFYTAARSATPARDQAG
jgi:hypothetical protein